MEIGKKFKNIVSYNKNMAKHIKDKLFWVNNFSGKDYNIVDFGCADGAIINYLCEINKNSKHTHSYIGYDISKTMIDIAKGNFNGDNEDVVFTSSWDEVVQAISNSNRKYRTNILLLSSVIHEVYSYAKSEEEIDEFWDRVLNTGFDYIIVRDMMVSYDTFRNLIPEEIGKRPDYNLLEIHKQTYYLCDDLKTFEKYKKQLEEFEEKHGSCKIVHNLLHFLLKYRWKINWEREVNENYFSIMIEDFLDLMKDDYNIDYFERFRVPFLDECFKKDFGIKLTDYTHIKAIFSRKKERFGRNLKNRLNLKDKYIEQIYKK